MLRILVVEDNQEKLRNILAALTEVPGCGMDGIDCAHDLMEAKRLLEEVAYELLIIDISIPARPDELPSPEGGMHLLEEIEERAVYKHPREIIGLTAYPEIRERAAVRFADDVWLVLLYDPASETWADQLRRKVRHILIAERSGSRLEFLSDLCIVVALPEPELSAVLEVPWEWKLSEAPGDTSNYYRGQFKVGVNAKIAYAAAASRMGMAATAALATKMIYTFRPRYIAMVGICAGIEGKCELGDVVAADPCWDYGSGKYYLKSGKSVFSAAPHQFGLNSFVRGKLGLLARDISGLATIQSQWKGPKPNRALALHIGPVASGAAVLEDPKVRTEIQRQHRKVIGIEMETYGLFAAVDEAPLPEPKAFAFKSVADFADEEKGDAYQAYASYTSASVLRLFAEKYLF